MRHKDRGSNHLDSPPMPFFTRQSRRRGHLAALLAVFVLTPLLAGCGEDRSNLIPGETADSLIATLDEVQALAASGQCFEAAQVAQEAQQEIEAMGPEVDTELKRSLIDGVTELQVLVNDPDKCTESGTVTIEEPTVIEEEPAETEGTTGDTGTTGSETPTGTTTDDEETPQQPQDGGDGQSPTTPPVTTPTEPTTPATPAEPTTPTTPSGPGSGGLGPG